MEGLAAVLPTTVWQTLLRAGRPQRYSRDEQLLRQGDDGTHVLLLTAGRVKVTRHEADGRELLLAVRGPGEALGEISAWDGSARSATVTALEACLTYILTAAQFRIVLDSSDSGKLLLRHVVSRLRESEDSRADLADLPAPHRIVRTLLRLGASAASTHRHGLKDAEKPVTIDLGLSQEELARAAGLSRSALAAELARLRRCGLVSTGRQRIVLLDVAGLSRLARHPGASPCTLGE
jgi:CRP/FNR family cyclic AMP-dependent transcriptional regulator